MGKMLWVLAKTKQIQKVIINWLTLIHLGVGSKYEGIKILERALFFEVLHHN